MNIIKNISTPISIFGLLLFSSFVFHTDKCKIKVDFKCTDSATGKRLPNVSILITINDSTNIKHCTDTVGKCKNVLLESQNTYIILCSYPGYLSKKIILNLTNFPDSVYKMGYELPLDLAFQDKRTYADCFDTNVMDTTTIATLQYNEKIQDMEWKINNSYKSKISDCSKKIDAEKKKKELIHQQEEIQNRKK